LIIPEVLFFHFYPQSLFILLFLLFYSLLTFFIEDYINLNKKSVLLSNWLYTPILFICLPLLLIMGLEKWNNLIIYFKKKELSCLNAIFFSYKLSILKRNIYNSNIFISLNFFEINKIKEFLKEECFDKYFLIFNWTDRDLLEFRKKNCEEFMMCHKDCEEKKAEIENSLKEILIINAILEKIDNDWKTRFHYYLFQKFDNND